MAKLIKSLLGSLSLMVLFLTVKTDAKSFAVQENPAGLLSPSGISQASRIDIAVSSIVKEEDPAVAVCGAYYLVVYEREGNIYGQHLDPNGSLFGSEFLVHDGVYGDADPDVSCLWPEIFVQTFMVVWTYDYNGNGTDYDIYAQAVSAGGGLFSTPIPVANTISHELKPAIACEEDDYYCLVVFENAGAGFNNIQGQRLYMRTLDIVREGDVFDPGSSVEVELNPDVTWSKTRGEYLVTWQCWLEYYIRDHYQIVFSLIYESEQGPGASEIFSGPYWLFSTGLGYDYDQADPAVAYNNLSGHYLITFTMESPDYKELVGVLLAGASLYGYPFDIAEQVYGAESAVAFSGGPGGEFNAEDEFLVTYTRLESNWQVEGAFISDDVLRDTDLLIGSGSTSNHMIAKPDITGYSQTGKYLVVWEECDAQNPWDCNVYGRLYGNWAYYKVYQPLIMR